MSVIVSANYRDRTQKNYEVRERVVIKNFKFCESVSGETGSGCSIVAMGDPEESEVDREKLVRIKFNGLRFVEHESGREVEGGRALVLDEAGMYYLPA